MTSLMEYYDQAITKLIIERNTWGGTKNNWKICYFITKKYDIPIKTRGYSALELALILGADYSNKLNEQEKKVIKNILGNE